MVSEILIIHESIWSDIQEHRGMAVAPTARSILAQTRRHNHPYYLPTPGSSRLSRSRQLDHHILYIPRRQERLFRDVGRRDLPLGSSGWD
jgi:hypothetical protein